jgi:beta-glucosidase/6-phospho-beta-glucosidase/beta-galactosidase
MTLSPPFLFATGIENSSPTINNGRTRIDELQKCGHYDRWQQDLDLVEDLGIRFLRYGLPLYKVYTGHGKFDWEFSDIVYENIRRKNIAPIADLCHFGVPDWIGDFQNPDLPRLLADYAREFALRYPWIQLFTPVNEMFITATFSAQFGWWNEQLADDRSFVNALKNIVKANVLAMQAIVDVRPDAIFIQSESSEYFHAEDPAAIGPAEVLNARRFLSLDLNYGRRIESEMYEFLMDNGLTRDEYHFFLSNKMKHHCIMGNDYYVTNEHRVAGDGTTTPSGEIFGYAEITWQYYDRYRIPVMHTETNLRDGDGGEDAVRWLRKEWANVLRVRNDGVPVVGFTWYSLTDQIDWSVALREEKNIVDAVGLYDLDRNIRPVGRAYKKLISDWRDVLPTQSVCLQVPVVLPQEYDEYWAQELRDSRSERRVDVSDAPSNAAAEGRR